MVSDRLSDEERARTRLHLGYPNVSAVAVFQLGIPAAIEPSFMLERAMDLLLPEGIGLVRQHLQILDQIQAQMVDDLELLAVRQVDEIQPNDTEQVKLENSYLRWRSALANIFGVIPNPYDKRYSGGAGGINVPVQH